MMNRTINMYILTFTNVALLTYIFQFSWVPYRGFEEHLPRHACRDREIWFAYTAIICAIVEWHQTNRVKLQFGLHQDIPVDPMNLG